ncbi:hypothetical protein CPB84DRAFT_138457 [Gymnopilus junonius]|uniref:Uncharacterized protein n=1 Tax=Gymnopilus junonius TaxID=109634 RepID=A0A9P5NEB4_GYMJU|nr:hypothetical protein CPB84DRAFT_138457 [Gymnopilus junonius]
MWPPPSPSPALQQQTSQAAATSASPAAVSTSSTPQPQPTTSSTTTLTRSITPSAGSNQCRTATTQRARVQNGDCNENYVVHELAQQGGAPRPTWTKIWVPCLVTMWKWDEVKVYVGKNRPLARHRHTCQSLDGKHIISTRDLGCPMRIAMLTRSLRGCWLMSIYGVPQRGGLFELMRKLLLLMWKRGVREERQDECRFGMMRWMWQRIERYVFGSTYLVFQYFIPLMTILTTLFET